MARNGGTANRPGKHIRGNLTHGFKKGAFMKARISNCFSSAAVFLLLAFVLPAYTSAQSLKPEAPYPMQAGLNKGSADSFVGAHYWYFYAMPGDSQVKVRFANATTLYGSPMKGTTLTITLYDEKRTWRNTKVITPQRNQTDATFTAENVKE